MRQNYNSFEYWKNFIMENRTIRGHMFMKNLPTNKSVYMHTLIFSKYGGLNSIWAYFPNIKVFIGYIQYSFLQEAFYTWINFCHKIDHKSCKIDPKHYASKFANSLIASIFTAIHVIHSEKLHRH